MHERDAVTEKEFDVLQMTVEHVLIQRFNQSTNIYILITYYVLPNINKCVRLLENQKIPVEECFSLEFFCHEKLKCFQICQK